MSTVSLRVKLTRRCLLVPINGVIIFLICVVDFRRIEYRRSAYIFQRQRLGLTPPIAMVEPFLIRQSVGQQTEEVYRPLRQWPPRVQTNEQWHAAPIVSLPSGSGETHADIAINVEIRDISEDNNRINAYLRGDRPANVTIQQRRSDVFYVQSNDVIIIDDE